MELPKPQKNKSSKVLYIRTSQFCYKAIERDIEKEVKQGFTDEAYHAVSGSAAGPECSEPARLWVGANVLPHFLCTPTREGWLNVVFLINIVPKKRSYKWFPKRPASSQMPSPPALCLSSAARGQLGWAQEGLKAISSNLEEEMWLPDNVKSWQKGRGLLRLLGHRESKRLLLPQASPRRLLKPFPLIRKTLSSPQTLLGLHLLGSLEKSPDPSFLIYQILTYSNSKNQKCYSC